MLRELAVPAIAALSLAACSGGAVTAETTQAGSAAAPATRVATAASPAPPGPPPPAATAADGAPAALADAGASIAGAIRLGNRPPPAMRVCAHPLRGGAPTCIDSPAGAREYRVEVAPGRYFLLGWVEAGEVRLLAHASQIRCIRAPCPPDELIEVAVAAGEARTGIDLTGGYIEVPQGWPQRP